MSDWTSGYTSDIEYTHGFYRELNPTLQSFAALAGNHRTSRHSDRPQYCELGCGQGFSVNLLAAANPNADFYATDFLSGHIANARGLAREAGLENARFFDLSFRDFADEKSLPESFDAISLHGVLSWVSPETRRDITMFVARKLKPGGLLYVSYNTLPGWAPLVPLRRILVDGSRRVSGNLSARIDEALAFADGLLSIDAGYFRQNGSVGKRLQDMMPMSRSYLAHEFFNENWTPFHFADMAQELAAARVSFASRMNLTDQIDDVTFTAEQARFLTAETDPVTREGLRDIILNEQFRTDLFAKGLHPHTFKSACAVWLDIPFISSHSPGASTLRIKGRIGTIELDGALYPPLLDAFSSQPRTLRDILTSGAAPASTWSQLIQAVTLLVGADLLQPCPDPALRGQREKSCAAFNRVVCEQAQEQDSLGYLASPVTGSGMQLNRFEQLFLLALDEGQKPEELADFVWLILKAQGQNLTRNGTLLKTDDENLTELRSQATDFLKGKLDLCRRLGVSTRPDS